jgi:hypothetical protein
MKQLGLALHNYHLTHNQLPSLQKGPSDTGPTGVAGQTESNAAFSIHVFLLPYVERTSLATLVDTTVDLYTGSRGVAKLQDIHVEATRTPVSLFRCPSSSTPIFQTHFNSHTDVLQDEVYACNNYVYCTGTGVQPNNRPGINGYYDVRNPTDGAFYQAADIGFEAFTDGTSNTMVLSEIITGEGDAAPPPSSNSFDNYSIADIQNNRMETTYMLNTFRTDLAGAMRNATADVVDILSLFNSFGAGTPKWRNEIGKGWIVGKSDSTLYNAFLLPNDKLPNVFNSNHGFIAARSHHRGIVNVLLADGSVRAVSDSISLNTWRAYSTIAGGEAVGGL